MDNVFSCSLILDPMSTYLTSSHFIEYVTSLFSELSQKKIHSYGSNEALPVLGKVTADVVSGKKLISATFHVVEGSQG